MCISVVFVWTSDIGYVPWNIGPIGLKDGLLLDSLSYNLARGHLSSRHPSRQASLSRVGNSPTSV